MASGYPARRWILQSAEWEFLLEPSAQGTLLTQRFRYLPQTAAAEQMVGAAGVVGITQACAANLARLKRVVEQKVTVLSERTHA